MATSATIETRRALITGITGQDGSYLLELLLGKLEDERPIHYTVYGMMRRNSTFTTGRIDHLFDHPRLYNIYGDSTDPSSIMSILKRIEADAEDDEIIEVYNLAAQSHVGVSFEVPLYTAQVDAIGTLNILEAIRQSPTSKRYRFYQASTSEMFGNSPAPQSEETPFDPRSPYACAKLYAHHITKNYREAYGLFACSGILFNHESERRGETFVTRKITLGIAKILKGSTEPLELGNLDSYRDWGYAPDYVRAMWMMLQSATPDDYVVATGESHTVREFVDRAFAEVDIPIKWEGEGDSEVGVYVGTGQVIVRINPRYYRPTEVDYLLGTPDKIRRTLGWEPSVEFQDLVRIMVRHDCNGK